MIQSTTRNNHTFQPRYFQASEPARQKVRTPAPRDERKPVGSTPSRYVIQSSHGFCLGLGFRHIKMFLTHVLVVAGVGGIALKLFEAFSS